MNPLPILLCVLLSAGLSQAQAPAEFDAHPHDTALQLIALKAAPESGPNLLANGNFEDGTKGWELIAFGKKGTMAIDTKELFDGKPTLRIDNLDGDHSFVRQILKGKPNTRYRLTGYIKTMNVEPVTGSGGAVVMIGMVIDTSEPLQKTTDWTRVSVDFTPEKPDEIRVGPSLGTYGRPVTGTAWFSGVTLIELGSDEKR